MVGGLRTRLMKALEELVEERRTYKKRKDELDKAKAKAQLKPQDEATKDEIDNLLRERDKLWFCSATAPPRRAGFCTFPQWRHRLKPGRCDSLSATLKASPGLANSPKFTSRKVTREMNSKPKGVPPVGICQASRMLAGWKSAISCRT